ncbi:MAG TPA: hypothetical protein VHP83_19625 [Aggregatilineaceae bacterium]|nr:hypothetical protein [Aggregatilineaceae bacterium]
MAELEDLLLQADKAFEEGDYAAAAEGYRAAATLSSHDIHFTLDNLNLSEEMEHLQFVNRLMEKFPDSWELRLHRLNFMKKVYPTSTVISKLSEELKQEMPTRYELSVHSSRFSAAAKARESKYFAEDLLYLWENMLHPRQRKHLLEICATVDAVEFIPAFETLVNQDGFPVEVKAFLRAKKAELQQLQTAIRQLEQT